MKIGDTISVTVTEVGQYGAYVRSLDGKIGFVHHSEFSWFSWLCDPRLPHEIVEVGQSVDVKVKGFIVGGRFSASIRSLNENGNPWLKISEADVGREFQGEILKVCEWGLFVKHPLRLEVAVPKSEGVVGSFQCGQLVKVVIETVDLDSHSIKGRLLSTD